MNYVAVSVHGYQSDAGAGEEHGHTLDATNRLTEPGLDNINITCYILIDKVVTKLNLQLSYNLNNWLSSYQPPKVEEFYATMRIKTH